jgi:hypothetical protein
MAPTVPSLMLIAALALAGAARAQDVRAAPSPPAAPGPMSIEDILNQSTDLEPSEAPPPPAADVGLTAEQLDLRIRGASAAAQGLQGPMDGTWSLQSDDGAGLYTFLFVDQPGPAATLEGAWRDLRRGEGLSGTGLIANLQRTGGLLQASFYPKGGVETAAISLIQNSDGAWSGQLVQGGITTPVRMIRNEPMLNATPLRYAGAGVVSPYRSPAANTRVAPAPKKKVVAKKRVVKKKVVAKKAPAKKAPVKAAAKPPIAKKKA